MDDHVLERFLMRQAEAGLALAQESDILRLAPLDGPAPQHYVAEFRARGLVKRPGGEVAEASGAVFGIHLPDDYLRRVKAPEILTCVEPLTAWHPNIHGPFVCISSLTPAMPLVDILYGLYEVWTWHLLNTGDPLNHAAARWARGQDPDRFPIDRRPLKRRDLHPTLETITKGAAQ